MSSPIWELQLGIVSMLVDDTSLQATLGDPMRVYDQPPTNPVFPYLTFGSSQSRVIDTQDAPAQEHDLSLHLWSRYHGRKETRDFMGTLCHHIENGSPTMTDYKIISLRPTFIDVFRVADGLTTHGVLRIKSITEPVLLPA